jgi:hypothetical protein
MSNRSPATFAKRQREMEKKRLAEQKRVRRAQRGDAPKAEEEILICKPIVDEEQV